MTRSFKIEPGRVLGLRDGVSFFDTDAYPVQYATNVLTVSGYTLTFPDFRKGNAYNWAQWDSTGSGGNPRESAISVITMPNQEWGPVSSSPTDAGTQIDDVVLGTVPDMADHILVRAKVSRTSNPSAINGNTIPVEPEPGQWTIAYGGTLLLEQLYPIARMIYVFLAASSNGDGTRNVMLRTLMSVAKARQGFYRAGNDYSKTGWNYGGTYGSVYGIPVSQRDTRAANTDVSGVGGRYKRTGSNPAATSDNTNYSSVYSIDFEITPGRSNITPTPGSGASSAYFGMVDEQFDEVSAAATHTVTCDFGDADATRNIIVGIVLQNGTSSSRDITGVTIGGVAATQVAYRKSTSGTSVLIAAIYIAAVPSGTSGTVVATCSGTMNQMCATVFAGYNMNSAAPDATITSGTANSNANLATVNGGLAIAIGESQPSVWGNIDYYQIDHANFWIEGLSSPALWPTVPSADSGSAYARNFGLTTGATEVLKLNYIGGTPGVAAWAAASFH